MKPLWLRILGWAIVFALLIEHGAHAANVIAPGDLFYNLVGMSSYLFVKFALYAYVPLWVLWRFCLRGRKGWEDIPKYPAPDAGHRWLG